MINPNEFLPALEEIARGAGAILLKHFRRLDGYDKKGSTDLVTIADKQAEDFVAQQIQKRFPDHAVLGEEGGRQGNPDSDYLWIVDPLDGTTNFAHGMRIFAVSIGLTWKGEVIAGAIFAPSLDEMYLAALGQGAYRNGDPIHVSQTNQLSEALLVTGFPYERAETIVALKDMLGECLLASRGVLRLGSAALDLAHVAAGELDAFYEASLHAWDVAAGVILLREAGGQLSHMLATKDFDLMNPNLIASNGKIHQELQQTIARGGAEKMFC